MACFGGLSPPSRVYRSLHPGACNQASCRPQWIHEIKHDGYRLIARVDGGRVRLFTRRGYDWTDRYPLIRDAMLGLPQEATIDGEAVVSDPAGVADFALLHRRKHDRQAFLYAFDLLELDGVDLRPLAVTCDLRPIGLYISDGPPNPSAVAPWPPPKFRRGSRCRTRDGCVLVARLSRHCAPGPS